ncbi:hypothetical protein [Aquabacterium humicola]|uniref:hypothetical protein n=1 Tax=Aquabacterium humicola TaxID=3237377 RepID=UPI00254312A9|nr:hypothetical protein [Rubrivivax pictus]
MTRRAAGFFIALALATLLPGLREVFEGAMALHMLLQLPALLAAGWLMAGRWHRAAAVQALGRAIAAIDAGGLFGATAASAVIALWMIPAWLDRSLLDPSTAVLKYASWLLAGVLLRAGAGRMHPTVAAFFLGNGAWMAATVGLLYQDEATRLCVSYLQDDQVWTGGGLVVAAVAMGALALRLVLRPPGPAPTRVARGA